MSETSERTLGRGLAALGALLWVTLVLAAYYWAHKPLTPALARALGGAALDVASAAALFALAGGVGRAWLRRVDVRFWSTPERLAAEAVLGLGALALLTLGVGMVWLYTLSVAALLGALALWARRDVRGWAREFAAWVRGARVQGRWARALAAYTLGMVALALPLALLPPTKWDVLTYHLVGPQKYLAEGRIYAVPHNHFLGFPQLLEMLYTAQLALTAQLSGAAVLHWGVGALALMAVGGYAARRGGQAAGWLAAALLLSAPSIWWELTFAYVDLLPIGVAVLALGALERSAQAEDGRPLVALVGALIGLALGTKYSALWLALALGVVTLGQAWRRGARAALRDGLIFAAAAGALFAPWLLRNALLYGNPLYPFGWAAGEMDAIRQTWYRHPGSALLYTQDAWHAPLLPLAATVFGVENAGLYGADIGPLFAALGPLVLLAWRPLSTAEQRTAPLAPSVAATVTAAWMLSAGLISEVGRQPRLVFYLFGPLALALALAFGALRRWPRKPFDLRFVLRGVLALTLGLSALSAARTLNGSYAHIYFSGRDDYRRAYLLSALPWHMRAMDHLAALPQGARVRFLWEPRSLYCPARVECASDSLIDGWYYARRTLGHQGVKAIEEAWRAEYDYLLVYEAGRRYESENNALYTRADWAAWDIFVTSYLVPIATIGPQERAAEFVIYRWRRAP